MSADWGVTSGKWMAQNMVARADPLLLKLAIINLISAFEECDSMSQIEVMDRIMQVAMTGTYRPPAENFPEKAKTSDLGTVPLSQEEKDVIDKFNQNIDKWLGSSATEEKTWEDYLKEKKEKEEDNE